MLRLENVNKYFNENRKNEIHVINETSLEMGSTGLVALLGPSGCGKTTLLNVIGGLDKVNSGKVFVNGQRITRRSSGRIDKIRNLNIGYIFQNYNLVENMTVFENIAAVPSGWQVSKTRRRSRKRSTTCWKRSGCTDTGTVMPTCFPAVSARSAVRARAIVKNPAIVIADEPTGNLDSKNTLEVMNIIKSISQEKLSILVTHEESG